MKVASTSADISTARSPAVDRTRRRVGPPTPRRRTLVESSPSDRRELISSRRLAPCPRVIKPAPSGRSKRYRRSRGDHRGHGRWRLGPPPRAPRTQVYARLRCQPSDDPQPESTERLGSPNAPQAGACARCGGGVLGQDRASRAAVHLGSSRSRASGSADRPPVRLVALFSPVRQCAGSLQPLPAARAAELPELGGGPLCSGG